MDEPSHNIFFNYIFKPTFVFVHIWPKIGLKQPSIFFTAQSVFVAHQGIYSVNVFPLKFTLMSSYQWKHMYVKLLCTFHCTGISIQQFFFLFHIPKWA